MKLDLFCYVGEMWATIFREDGTGLMDDHWRKMAPSTFGTDEAGVRQGARTSMAS